jgi:hypothetical protein
MWLIKKQMRPEIKIKGVAWLPLQRKKNLRNFHKKIETANYLGSTNLKFLLADPRKYLYKGGGRIVLLRQLSINCRIG